MVCPTFGPLAGCGSNGHLINRRHVQLYQSLAADALPPHAAGNRCSNLESGSFSKRVPRSPPRRRCSTPTPDAKCVLQKPLIPPCRTFFCVVSDGSLLDSGFRSSQPKGDPGAGIPTWMSGFFSFR